MTASEYDGYLAANEDTGETAPTDGLTRRRREIMDLLYLGLGNKEIARHLEPACSEATVKTQLKLIYARLGVHNRAEAAAVWVTVRERDIG